MVTPKMLAELTGLEQSLIEAIEAGDVVPTRAVLIRYLDGLRADVAVRSEVRAAYVATVSLHRANPHARGHRRAS